MTIDVRGAEKKTKKKEPHGGFTQRKMHTHWVIKTTLFRPALHWKRSVSLVNTVTRNGSHKDGGGAKMILPLRMILVSLKSLTLPE